MGPDALRGLAGKAVYVGAEEFTQFVDTWMEPFDTWTMEAEEILDGSADQVVVLLHQHARLKESTGKIDMRYGAIYTVVDGVVVRADAYSPAERALAAAGLGAT